jgi:hypothetical protein
VKKVFYILIILFLFFGGTGSVSGQDSIMVSYPPNDLRIAEPVTFDTDVYRQFKKDKLYNYYVVQEDKPSLVSRLLTALFLWIIRHLDADITRKQFDTAVWVIGIVLILAVVAILYWKKPALFYFIKKRRLNYSVEEDDIYGTDFDRSICEAVEKHQYSDAIRWMYLKVLKALHEKELISYDANKTVNEYVYEIKNVELRKLFKTASLQFVYYRYGNSEADEARWNDFQSSSETILNRIR